MPSRTWTPAAVSSERRRLRGRCWRSVEAQHHISTMKIVDTLDEQRVLESLIDRTKPAVPPECRELHYLLATPFRYGAPYPTGSRFRRPGLTPGVFYASSTAVTAMIEAAFHRLLFFADSPDTPWPPNAAECTVFATEFRTAAGLDLTRPPLDRDAARWMHATDYAACQDLADAARTAGVEAIRYASARDQDGRNYALLTCRAFASREPAERQTWRLHVGAHGARVLSEFPHVRLEFGPGAFGSDPRISALRWQR